MVFRFAVCPERKHKMTPKPGIIRFPCYRAVSEHLALGKRGMERWNQRKTDDSVTCREGAIQSVEDSHKALAEPRGMLLGCIESKVSIEQKNPSMRRQRVVGIGILMRSRRTKCAVACKQPARRPIHPPQKGVKGLDCGAACVFAKIFERCLNEFRAGREIHIPALVRSSRPVGMYSRFAVCSLKIVIDYHSAGSSEVMLGNQSSSLARSFCRYFARVPVKSGIEMIESSPSINPASPAYHRKSMTVISAPIREGTSSPRIIG